MTWDRWGQVLVDADASNKRVFQRWTPAKNLIMDRIRCELEIIDDPTFTSVNFKLYSSRNGVAGILLATSDPRTKAEIMDPSLGFTVSVVDGRVELNWDFPTRPTLKAGTEYIFVINGIWTFTDSKHVRWNKAWPEDPYSIDTTATIQTGAYVFRPLGSEL